MGISLGNGIKHQLQAGTAAHKHLRGLAAQNLGKQTLCSGNTGQLTVVTDIDSIGNIVSGVLHQIENITHQIQLSLSGLTASHIQTQTTRLQIFKFLLESGVFNLALFSAHLSVSNHC